MSESESGTHHTKQKVRLQERRMLVHRRLMSGKERDEIALALEIII